MKLAKARTFLSWLDGKKTYLVATAGTILNILVIVDPNLLNPGILLKLDAILAALGGAALRSAVNKSPVSS